MTVIKMEKKANQMEVGMEWETKEKWHQSEKCNWWSSWGLFLFTQGRTEMNKNVGP